MYYNRSNEYNTPEIMNSFAFLAVFISHSISVLGFFHEQSRSDRDKYVKINWENILDGKEGYAVFATEKRTFYAEEDF